VVQGQTVEKVITATPAPTKAEPTKAPALAKGSVQINGSGATFPLPVYNQWTFAYQYVDPSVAINYQGIGSGGGKKAIIEGTVDFAGSDSLLTDKEYTDGKDLQMLPLLAGAVVPIYNQPDLPATPVLILNGKILVDIYNAKITSWDDPAIVALNPGLKDKLSAVKNKKITVVHRSDGSGTTEIFTKALASFSTDWKAGAAASIEWPVDKAGNGIGGKGNQGVAAAVINTPGSIGYVELSYAKSNNMPFAQLVNAAGKTVTADAKSTQSAMSDFAGSFSDKLTTDIVNGKGADSWPIVGYTYLIIKMKDMKDCTKATKLVEYINWSLTDASAAKVAADLGYAVLPKDVQAKVLAKLGEVTCSGKPVISK
jgi:phosphate transport system substrate-binding protein